MNAQKNNLMLRNAVCMAMSVVCCTFAMWSAKGSDVFVECESFAELGGWVVDAYSMRNMGSAYVMAHGCGRPVADAVGTVTVPAQGKYAVWARTRNWNAEWTKGAAGRFKVKVNGADLPGTLGVGDGSWSWRKAGEVSLPAGRAEVALHDLTGFNGRCDALFLTTAAFDARTAGLAAEKARTEQEIAELTLEMKNRMKLSYNLRMIALFALMVVGISVFKFDPIATILPILFPTIVIRVLQIMEARRPSVSEGSDKP